LNHSKRSPVDSLVHVTANLTIPAGELRFRTSRSGGPGGQNVNKLETKVELLFDIAHSPSLTDRQKQILLSNLKSRLDAEGVLRIVSQESRSQWKNKEVAIEKLAELLRRALRPRKKRIKTAPTRASKERRVRQKKRIAEKKAMRKVHRYDE
jgi:ribosome-associated protein